MPGSNSEKLEALQELGANVRAKREEKGITLESIFERTRIRVENLEGIEAGDFSNFPNIVYIQGFIRTYLNVIGESELYPEFVHWLNYDSNTHIKDGHKGGGGDFAFGPYAPPPEGFKPASRFSLFLVLILIIAGASTYVWYSWNKNGVPSLIRPNAPVKIAPVAATSHDVKKVTSSDVKPAASADVKKPEVKKPAAPVKPSLSIKANDDCWLSIRIGSKVVAQRTIKKGDVITEELTGNARVNFGRPWAVTVIHNGKDLGTPYKSGPRKSQTHYYNVDGKSGKVE